MSIQMTDSRTLRKQKQKQKLRGESGVSSWEWVVGFFFFFAVFFFFFFLGVDVDLFLFVQETVTCVLGQGLRFWNLFLKGPERAPCSIWWSRGWRVGLSWSGCGRFPWAAGFSWFSPSSWFGDLRFKVRPFLPCPLLWNPQHLHEGLSSSAGTECPVVGFEEAELPSVSSLEFALKK